MKLNRVLCGYIGFAAFLKEHNIERPYDLAVLIHYANRAYNAGERATGDSKAEKDEKKFGDLFEEQAKKLGFGVEWNGLWPTLTKGKQSFPCPV